MQNLIPNMWQMVLAHILVKRWIICPYVQGLSSIGSVTYSTAKELSGILKPLVGRSPHHVMNNLEFLESIKGIQLQPEECMVSYDVEALFTSVPVEESISIIENLLEEDKDLHQRTAMSVNQIICLLKFCLNTTYFTFQGKMV